MIVIRFARIVDFMESEERNKTFVMKGIAVSPGIVKIGRAHV